MKRHRLWFRYHPPTTFENAEKVTRLYLHASVSGYTCMQAYPGATQSGVSEYHQIKYINCAFLDRNDFIFCKK